VSCASATSFRGGQASCAAGLGAEIVASLCLQQVKFALHAAARFVADAAVPKRLVNMPALRLDQFKRQLVGHARPVGLGLGALQFPKPRTVVLAQAVDEVDGQLAVLRQLLDVGERGADGAHACGELIGAISGQARPCADEFSFVVQMPGVP
jgi:hypothetical protein